MHDELREGIRSSPTYTVQTAVYDWLAHGLPGRSAKTISTNREALAALTALIGAAKLRELTAADVRSALAELAATRSTRTVQIAHNGLVRAIRYAEANDLVGRNVAALVDSPEGLEGRPSKSLTLPQAQALIKAAKASRLRAYIVLSLLTGCRPEEARALRWDHVDLDGDPDTEPPVPRHVAVWRSVRLHGDVKTKSRGVRFVCRYGRRSVEGSQSEAGRGQAARWSRMAGARVGVRLSCWHSARSVPCPARLPEGVYGSRDRRELEPRELRHTFVSIMSEQGVPVPTMRLPVGGGFVVAQRHRTAGSGAVGGGRTGRICASGGC